MRPLGSTVPATCSPTRPQLEAEQRQAPVSHVRTYARGHPGSRRGWPHPRTHRAAAEHSPSPPAAAGERGEVARGGAADAAAQPRQRARHRRQSVVGERTQLHRGAAARAGAREGRAPRVHCHTRRRTRRWIGGRLYEWQQTCEKGCMRACTLCAPGDQAGAQCSVRTIKHMLERWKPLECPRRAAPTAAKECFGERQPSAACAKRTFFSTCRPRAPPPSAAAAAAAGSRPARAPGCRGATAARRRRPLWRR